MRTTYWALLVMVCSALAACRDAVPPTPASAASRPPVRIGAEGGTLTSVNGARLVIPRDALASEIAFAFGFTRVGSSPALPAGVMAVGPTYSLSPRDVVFRSPIEVAIPFDHTQVPEAARPQLLLARGVDAPWVPLGDAEPRDNTLTGHASYSGDFVVVVPLAPDTP
jgi:hypothetical protein